MEKSALRAADLTKQLLGFARKGKYEKKSISLNHIIEEAKEMLSHSLSKSVKMNLNLLPDLWPTLGDSSQLLQVIMNLAINANDAIPEGGTITFETKNREVDSNYCRVHKNLKPGRYAMMSVQDNGTGIPKELLSKIFDPFFTTKDVGKGTGLGLSMVFGIVENHGGAVSVYSELGHGTVFNIFLPIDPNNSLSQTIIELSKIDQEAKSCPLFFGKTFLIVDDEDVIRDLVADLLKGAKLIMAKNGKEAVEMYINNFNTIDVVLMDVKMPVMDGIQAYREMIEVKPDLKLIFASGYSESDEIAELRENSNIDFIQKPYQSAELYSKISKALKGDDSNLA